MFIKFIIWTNFPLSHSIYSHFTIHKEFWNIRGNEKSTVTQNIATQETINIFLKFSFPYKNVKESVIVITIFNFAYFFFFIELYL